jgi:cellobiose phosphorylase
LGLQLEVDHLRIAPCIPDHWDSYKIHYRFRETVYHINIRRVAEKSNRVNRVSLDGVVINGKGGAGRIPLVDDHQEHYVEVELS